MNVFELPPAAPNPPYTGGGPYVGCTAATAADFIAAYTGKAITDLNALFASMTRRHRNVDPSCDHGLRPHGGCGYCIFLELSARGLPVGYGHLSWPVIRAYLNAGQYVALAGLYSRIPVVAPGSYSAKVPARGRSDSFTGAHMFAAYGTQDAGMLTLVKDPDFGNWRGTPPYSILPTSAVQAFYESLDYPTCYATKAPPAAPAPPPPPKYGVQPMDPTIIPDEVVDISAGATAYALVNGALVVRARNWGAWKGVGTYGVQPHAEPPRVPPAAPLRAIRVDTLGGPPTHYEVWYVGADHCSNKRPLA